MQYVSLTRVERKTLLEQLDAMPDLLAERFASLSAEEATVPGPGGGFSPVEQCWHLADLEREGFGVRIRRMLHEDDPALPDFDGDGAARERQYRRKTIAAGIQVFREARAANLALFRSLASDEWSRGGTQEGVGRIALCDIPDMMMRHDTAHRAEIDAWFAKGGTA